MKAQPANTSGFANQLKAARAKDNARERLDSLAALAGESLGMLETIQLDRALNQSVDSPAGSYTPLRLALLSSDTIDQLLPAIRVAGLRYKFAVEITAGTFGQYRQEILDPASPLAGFRPDVIVFSISARQFISGVPISANAQQVEETLSGAIDDLSHLWRVARNKFDASVVQQTCLDRSEPLFGSYDRQVPASPMRLVNRLNDLIAQAATQHGVMLLDAAQSSARDGLDAWFDAGRWLQGKMEIAPHAAPRYGNLLMRIVAAHRGISRKCLVLDLDNTLWGGIVGEVGLAGIILGEGSAQGEAHLALQRYAKLLKQRGIILAVCSKNETQLAESVFDEHPEMVLKRSDIAAFVANWDDKAANLRVIAQRLNIGLDSLVFVDDNPAERERIRQALPVVAVPDLPRDPAMYVRCIAEHGYFETTSLTNEDLQRNEQYASNEHRESLRDASGSIDDFLRSLEMTVKFGPVSAVDHARVTQLINKTNQFNTTTRRYSGNEIERFAQAQENITLQFRLADRFGDNGLVSVMILRPAGAPDTLDIDTWVMSCRVFGRQLENEAMSIAVEAAGERNIRFLRAEYIPTDRNGVIRDLFAKLGFIAASGTESDDSSHWLLNIADYVAPQTFIARKGT